jgi:hypothetical protein
MIATLASDKALSVKIDPPVAGWINVSMRDGPDRYEFDASCVPTDAVQDLVSALLAVARFETTRQVYWHQEPAVVVLELASVGREVSLVLRDDGSNGEAHPRFSFAGSRDGVLRPFCESLERLQARQPSVAYEREWRHRFPESAVERLRAALDGS